MKKFTFETSVGRVVCAVDTDKPCISSDPKFPNYIISEGEVTILEGREHLDKLYTWEDLELKSDWVHVELSDGYYGSPEYRVVWVE